MTIEDEEGEEIEVGGQASLGTVCNLFYLAHGSYGYSQTVHS